MCAPKIMLQVTFFPHHDMEISRLLTVWIGSTILYPPPSPSITAQLHTVSVYFYKWAEKASAFK